jgi:glutathione S-transferase
MTLTLHFHPLASYCHKALIALYENETPFTPQVVDLMDDAVRAAFRELWPIGKMPVLRDDARDQTVPESSIVIEYLAQHHPGRVALVPADPDRAREARLWDRFFDFYVDDPMAKIVDDRLRPADRKDPHGVAQARAMLDRAYEVVERTMATRTWALGDDFSMADCAAAPALFYASQVHPFASTHRHAAAYLGRLVERPSYARVLREMQPYRDLFPG